MISDRTLRTTPPASVVLYGLEPVDVLMKSALCFTLTCIGELKHDGKTQPVMTPLGATSQFQYRHICTVCGNGVWLEAAYPHPVYVPKPAAAEYEPADAGNRLL